ncbi:unnamed protein product [Discosporangium mesarthrocarpum]
MARGVTVAVVVLVSLASSCSAFHVQVPSKRLLTQPRHVGFSSGAIADTFSRTTWRPRAVGDVQIGHLQRQGLVRPLNVAAGGGGNDSPDTAGDRTPLRRAILGITWLALVVYGFGPFAPGEVSTTLAPGDMELVMGMADPSSSNPFFYAVFNLLGVIPIVMFSLLCGGGAFKSGRQPVPPVPFIVGSLALGFFSIGPYLTLRNWTPEWDGEPAGLLEKIMSSRITGIVSLVLTLLIFNFCVQGAFADPGTVQGYADILSSSRLAAVSTVDFCILNLAIIDVMREDMLRRGVDPTPAKLAQFIFPVAGPALWTAVRPPVATE